MPKCRNCVHWEVCVEYLRAFWGYKARFRSPIVNASADSCIFYKDCSRFVELPIKPGESFFMPAHNQISEYSVDRVVFSRRGVHIRHTLVSGLHYANTFIYPEAIGKTIFLTREAAEQALKELES